MIDQDLAIEPPPSLEAILSHPERIGRVDFTHRLVVDAPPPPEEDETGQEAGQEAAPEAASQAAEPTAATAPEPSTVPTPVLVPEDRVPEDATPASDDSDPRQDLDDFLVAPPADDSPASLTGAEASAQVAALLSLVPAEDMDTVTEDVSEVVQGVVARIREVRSATLAHLEAIEVEAALRCEMLTAQAELDAELIRLHARREAHAIVAAARARAGMPPAADDDVRRLDQLAGAASRLVDSLEELGPRAGSPDDLFLP